MDIESQPDMTTKKWTITGVLIPIALGLAGLGFAAMSANPAYHIPNGLLILLFVLAGVVFIALIFYISNDTTKRISHRIGQLLTSAKNLRVVMKDEKDDDTAFQIDIINRSKAINRLLILGRDFSALTISRGMQGWPVQYPLRLYNTRPIPIEIIGYSVTIFLADIPMQVIEWNKPAKFASNSATVNWPISLFADARTSFAVPVVLSLMQNTLPNTSPTWGISGELRLQGEKEVIRREFEFKNDYYRLSDADWTDLRQHSFPKGVD
jgi:hypothetical protein